jgi:BEN domain
MSQLKSFSTKSEESDSKLINFLLEAVFDKRTLITSTMTGRCPSGTTKRLDPSKMGFIKDFFWQHLLKGENDVQNMSKRFKQFNQRVAQKLRNMKKSYRLLKQ